MDDQAGSIAQTKLKSDKQLVVIRIPSLGHGFRPGAYHGPPPLVARITAGSPIAAYGGEVHHTSKAVTGQKICGAIQIPVNAEEGSYRGSSVRAHWLYQAGRTGPGIFASSYLFPRAVLVEEFENGVVASLCCPGAVDTIILTRLFWIVGP
jgi:hypothetical protein